MTNVKTGGIFTSRLILCRNDISMAIHMLSRMIGISELCLTVLDVATLELHRYLCSMYYR